MGLLYNEEELWKVFLSAVQHQVSAFSQWDWKNSLHHYIVGPNKLYSQQDFCRAECTHSHQKKKDFFQELEKFSEYGRCGKIIGASL